MIERGPAATSKLFATGQTLSSTSRCLHPASNEAGPDPTVPRVVAILDVWLIRNRSASSTPPAPRNLMPRLHPIKGLLRTTCAFAYPRHIDVSDIIHPRVAFPSPTDRFGSSDLNEGEERPNTSGCRGRRRASYGSYDGCIQGSSQATRALLPSGSCSANVSVPRERCYAPPEPILSWRFSSSRAHHPTPVCCTGRDAQPVARLPTYPRNPSRRCNLHLPNLAKDPIRSAKLADLRASSDMGPGDLLSQNHQPSWNLPPCWLMHPFH